ncbi:hypothetical protein ASPWEDRAFT_35458 [Aspergillus terreus]|uniref:Uncharacterized protein n=1 Tax=Aspergillus terreus TaxID=33178 RepID=A0A5M3Z5S1_ASPTE|nr:hypothetical protein ATETN484_0010014200 [Aspergillus terreus]GFF18192.1 hypothetical protein ASPWEDRAFT_35458 [Aspergillus terreus]
MLSKSTPADAKSTYSVSSTATTLKGTEAPSKKWSLLAKKEPNTTKSTSPKTEAAARHNEAIATYLAFR